MPDNLLRRTTYGLRWTVAAGVLAGSPVVAQAQAEEVVRGFHLGLTLPAGRLGATMRKTVDNTAPTRGCRSRGAAECFGTRSRETGSRTASAR